MGDSLKGLDTQVLMLLVFTFSRSNIGLTIRRLQVSSTIGMLSRQASVASQELTEPVIPEILIVASAFKRT